MHHKTKCANVIRIGERNIEMNASCVETEVACLKPMKIAV